MAIFSSIAAGISGLLAGTFLASGVGAFILKAAVGIGLNLLASSLAGQPEQTPFAIQGQLQSGGDVARSFPIGYTATAGSLVYANTWADGGKTPNAYFTQVIALADLPGSALAGLWVNGEKCTIDYDNHAYPDWGFPVKEYEDDGDNALWIKFYDGTQTAADPFLVNTVSSPNRPYEDTRVGVGVAYVVITAQVKEELFTGFPTFKFELNGIKLYDPSKDSSVGGVGPQRWSDPSTWGGDGDHLPAVQLYNVLRGVTFQGTWFYGLQGMSAARLPVSAWIAAIAKCRATIKGAGGALEPMFRCGGEIQVGAQIADAVKAILTSAQARLSEAGGEYTMQIGASDASTYGITDADILSTEEQSFSPFFGLADTINGIVATYPSPAEGWNAKPAPPRYSPTFEAEDGNRRLLSDVTLDFVPYKAQVQRLMKSALEEARRARRHTFVLPPKYWPLMPGDFVTWTSVRNGYEAKKFRVDGVIDRENLDIVVDMTEVDPTDYDWEQDTDFRVEPDGKLDRSKPLPQPIVDWYAAPAEIRDGLGVPRRPAIRLSWDNDAGRLVDVSRVTFAVRLKATGEVVLRGGTDDPSAGATLISQNLLPSVTYQARGKLVPVSDRKTTWSDWLDVTTPEILLTAADILDDAITAAKIQEAAITADKIMTEAVTELKLADRAVSDLKIKLAAIKTELIGNQAVVAAALADVAVTQIKLADNAVTVNKIASGAVIASKIADAAITTAKFAAGLTPVEIVTSLPTTGNFEGRQAFYNGKTYRYTSGAWDASSPLVPGQVTSVELQDGAAIAAKISAGAVGNAQLAALAVDAANLATNAVTTTKIADDAITTPKLVAGAVVADKVAAGAITAGKLLVSDATNLIMNGSFTSGQKDGWSVYSGSTLTVYAGSARAPAVADWIGGLPADPTTQNAEYFLDVPCKPGDEFFISADVASSGSSPYSQAQCGIYWYDANNVYISNTWLPAQQLYTAWVTMSGTLVAPANAAKMQRFRMTRVAGNNGSLFFTNVQLRKRNSGELIVDGAITAAKVAALTISTDKLAATAVSADKLQANSVIADKINANAVSAPKIAANAITSDKLAANSVIAGKIAAGAVTATEIAANAITAAKLLLTDFSNLVVNGDFSQGLDGWTNSGGWQAAVELTLTTPMSFFLAKAVTTTGTFIVHQENQFAVNGGEEYYLEAMVQASSTGGAVRLQLHCQNNGGDNAYVRLPDTVFASGMGWTRVSGRVTIPASINGNPTTKARFWVEARDITNATGTIRFGKVFVRRANNAELIVDGAIIASKIEANAVTTEKISAGAVTATEIATNAVIAAKISAGAVTAGKVAADAITATNIVAGTITSTELASSSVTAIKIAAGTITGDKIAANSIGAGHIAANSITAKQMVLTDFSNLVVNGDFSQELDGWTNSGGFAHQVEASATSPVNAYAYKTGMATGQTYVLAQDNQFAVNPGDEYYVEAWLNAAAGFSGVIRVHMQFQDTNATANVYGAIPDRTFSNGGGWAKNSGSITVPGAVNGNPTVKARLRVEVRDITAAGGTARIGKIFVRRKNNAELIVDGSITADHLAVNSITVGKIADGAITNDKLGNSAVTAVKIANGAITAAKIEAGTITADRLVLGGVTTDRIGANAVTLVSSAYSNGNTGDFGPGGSTTVTIQSASISLADADAIDIVVSFGINQSAQYWTSSAGTTVTTVELLRGSTVINTITVNDSSFGLDPSLANARFAIRPTVSFSFSDTSFTGTGTVTYSVRCSSVYGAGTVTARNRYMRLMATKR